jgi:hypothetical protein
VLKELDIREIEQMTRDEVHAYQERRREQLQSRHAKEIEQADFERYKEAFTAAGGRESSAKAAWEAHRGEQAQDRRRGRGTSWHRHNSS